MRQDVPGIRASPNESIRIKFKFQTIKIKNDTVVMSIMILMMMIKCSLQEEEMNPLLPMNSFLESQT